MLLRPLNRSIRQAIPPVIKILNPEANRRLARKEIIRKSKILQIRQLTHTLRNRSGQSVVGHVQLLHLLQPSDRIGNGPHKPVEAQIQHRQLLQQPDLTRYTRSEPVIHEDDLVQRLRHVTEPGRHAAAEPVVRKHDHRNRRIPNIFGQIRHEPVVIDKDRVQILVEERSRDLPLELVETEI